VNMGARGSLTLFRDVFEPETAELQVSKSGRSAELHSKRNECLVDRYYFYGKYTEKRYMAILSALREEFFLSSEITLPRLISDNYGHLAELKALQPPVAYFKKKWPHLVWQ